MTKAGKQTPMWRSNRVGTTWEPEGMLVAYWEVEGDPISDEYTPKEISARELFNRWAAGVQKRFPNNLIPIHWFLEYKGKDLSTFEGMPFQFEHIPDSFPENFLTFFTWPVNSKTGEQLNWLTLQVADKLWNRRRADKGGFIQEATGWKPAILQPYVYLPSLMSALNE